MSVDEAYAEPAAVVAAEFAPAAAATTAALVVAVVSKSGSKAFFLIALAASSRLRHCRFLAAYYCSQDVAVVLDYWIFASQHQIQDVAALQLVVRSPFLQNSIRVLSVDDCQVVLQSC